MNRSVPMLLLCLGVLCLVPSAVTAQVDPSCLGWPDSQASSVPPVIVGTASGARINSGYEVIVRGSSGAPIPYAIVSIDFRSSDIVPFRHQIAPVAAEPGYCGVVSAAADANGRVVFDVRFSGFDNDADILVYARRPHAFPTGCCPGFTIGHIKGRSTDIITSVDPVDFCCAMESTDQADLDYIGPKAIGGAYYAECDLNLDGVLTLTDFNLVVAEKLSAVPALLCVP